MNISRTNIGQFNKGWVGLLFCSICNKNYTAESGNSKYCLSCREKLSVCPACGNNKSIYDKFCGKSCYGKYNYANNENVRRILALGTFSIKRGIGISEARLGRPRYDIRGENNPNWKGGYDQSKRITTMHRVEYINWRKKIFERDNYTCQSCKIKGKRLNAHHIIPYSVDADRILDVNNGITLCMTCHIEEHKNIGMKKFGKKKFLKMAKRGKSA